MLNNKILTCYKPIGITPLQLIDQIKETYPELQNEKISYAGRLDPMAHGIMLFLIGEENKNRSNYLSLNKSYEFEVLLGVSSDTYDILGLLQDTKLNNLPNNFKQQINEFLKNNIGKQQIQYPPFSSKPVNGKPLHYWSKNNLLADIEIPSKDIEIYDFKLITIDEIPVEKINIEIIQRINKITGDFRQEEIKDRWNHFFDKLKQEKITLVKFSIECSSGTYVRFLANKLGEELKTGALAFDILRTQIGEYTLSEISN